MTEPYIEGFAWVHHCPRSDWPIAVTVKGATKCVACGLTVPSPEEKV